MGLNDEREKLRQARAWLAECEISSQHFQAAWDHVWMVMIDAPDFALREEARQLAVEYWQKANGFSLSEHSVNSRKGCPLCGAVRTQQHGSSCPNTQPYDENGNVIVYEAISG